MKKINNLCGALRKGQKKVLKSKESGASADEIYMSK
jgi:hypothetical protein